MHKSSEFISACPDHDRAGVVHRAASFGGHQNSTINHVYTSFLQSIRLVLHLQLHFVGSSSTVLLRSVPIREKRVTLLTNK